MSDTGAATKLIFTNFEMKETGRRNPRAELALALADFLRGDPTAPKKAARQPKAH